MKKLLVLAIMIAATMISGCAFAGNTEFGSGKKVVTGEGATVKKSVSLPEFTSIEIDEFVGNITYSESATSKIIVSGPENVIGVMKMEVKNGKLTVGVKDGYRVRLKKDQKLQLTINSKSLAELETNFVGNFSASRMKGTNVTIENNGVGELCIKNINAQKTDIEVNGVGKVAVNGIMTEILNAECNGVGDMTLSGIAKKGNLQTNGVGSVKASKLRCGTANVEASGVGSVTVWCDGKSKVNKSGIGGVKILGPNK
ncbi:MAG: GIN domain-containing protein [Candidatus Limisoma sp.]